MAGREVKIKMAGRSWLVETGQSCCVEGRALVAVCRAEAIVEKYLDMIFEYHKSGCGVDGDFRKMASSESYLERVRTLQC